VSPIAAPHLDWPVLLPMLVVTGTAFACLVVDLIPTRGGKGHLAGVGVVGLGVALVLPAVGATGAGGTFQRMVALDGIAIFANAIFCITTALVLLLSAGYLRRRGVDRGEYYVLVMFAAVGMMLMGSALDLLVVFLGLELMSLALYVLAGFFRALPEGNEASMKYFLLGAFASGFFLYGIALLFGATGTTNLERLAADLATPERLRDPLVLTGVALLLVGFGFKASAVPFHQWAPDVYEGAPTAVAALIATGAKAAALAALMRVLSALPGLQADWSLLLWLLAALSMTVGNVIALVQHNVKRLLAYSSIAHVGYMLMGLAAGVPAGGAPVLYYLLIYSFATIGAFGVILLLERRDATGAAGEATPEAVEIDAYAGLASRHPVLALTFAVFLLSLIGMPPTAGFVGKLYLFSAAIGGKLYWLAVIAGLNSVVAAYYYLRLVVYMYMREPEGAMLGARLTPAAGLSLAVAAWATLHLGLLPGAVFEAARRALAP
jgi:NADH-quinone oxidoreductase subunit N